MKSVKKEGVAMLILALSFLLLVNLSGSEENGINDYVSGEIIVKYNDNVVSAEGNEIVVENRRVREMIIYEDVESPIEIEKITPNSELYTLRFDSSKDVEKLVDEYGGMDEVEYAEPNYILTSFNLDPLTVPNDPNYSLKWGLVNINAERAWNLTTGNGSEVVIAIIDTGVDWDHPDLSANIWNNSDENCTDDADLDGNGYNGDCRGYDFTDINTTLYVNAGYTLDEGEDYNTTENNPMDYHGHGTHCAGIAAAVSNNSVGSTGVCWNCSIMPVRAGFKIQHPTQGWVGSLETDDVVSAIYYAGNNNATIISMSFGGSHSATMQAAINASYGNGSIMLASAGNSGANSKIYPCGYDNVICVAWTSNDNSSHSNSNYGSWVDVAAPGTNVWSTYYDDRYVYSSGTSMSTPMVAGAVGLIKSLFDKNQTEIRDAINSTGKVVDFSGVDIPRIDVYSAILSFDETAPNVSLVFPANAQVNLTLNQTFTCNTSDWQLKNVTFEIWNSSDDLYYNASQDISGIFNETSFNITGLNYDNYKWNCKSYDVEDNGAYASSNFTLFVQNMSVGLVSPTNGTNSKINLTYFNCSGETETSKVLVNVTFNLWNSSSLIYNSTSNISGKSNSSLFNYTFTYEDNYLWNCETFNNESESTISLSNSSFIYDATNPNVSLLDPADSSSYTSNSQTVNFGFNISDGNNFANCSLIVNGVLSSTNSSVDKSITQNFSADYTPGTYVWSINCSDDGGNVGNSSQRTFSVSAPASDDGGGGGGGGGGGAVVLSNTYIISSEQGSAGYKKELGKNDKIKFTFFDSKEESHSLIVNEVNASYVKITIQSNPITLKLGIGQSAKLNLTSSDYYDLFVRLNSIKNNKADITIQLIKENIFREDIPDITGDVVEDKSPEEGDQTQISELDSRIDQLRNNINFLVLFIIMVLIFVLFIERKYIEDKMREIHLLEHKEKFNKEVKPR